MSIGYEYDPEHTLSYGHWSCPACGSGFFGGGEALHNRGCPSTGYTGCVYHFGPVEVARAKDAAERTGDERTPTLGPLSVAVLRQEFPALMH